MISLKAMFKGSSSDSELSDIENPEDLINENHGDWSIYESSTVRSIRIRTNKKLGIAHQLWPAASFLCKYIEGNMSTILPNPSSCNILELGAGVGLCGSFLAALGCKKVVMTDLSDALGLLNENIIVNNIESNAVASILRWGIEEDIHQSTRLFGGESFLVIAADCVYWQSLYKPFYETLCILTDMGATVLLAHVKRWKKDNKFFSMCRQRLDVQMLQEEVKVLIESPSEQELGESVREMKNISRIYRITRKEGK